MNKRFLDDEYKENFIKRALIYGGRCPKCGDFLITEEKVFGWIVQRCINFHCDYEKDITDFKEEEKEPDLIEELLKETEIKDSTTAPTETGALKSYLVPREPIGVYGHYEMLGTLERDATGYKIKSKNKKVEEIEKEYFRKILEY